MKKRDTTVRNKLKEGGIYAITVKGKPIYIGSTTRPFKERFKEHKEGIESHSSHLKLYKEMTDDERENYKFKILVDIAKAKYTRKPSGLNYYELQWIELGFIMAFQPKYNLAGLTTDFIFRTW